MDVFDLYAKIGVDTNGYENALDKAADKTNGFAGKLKTAFKVGAAAIGVATGAVVGFAKSAVDAGMEFDAAMSQVSAVSGATGKDFDALRDKAMEMGSKTKFSATESAEAFNYMAMAGWKTGDMLNGIEGIMNLAAASGEDLATTSDIVTDALTAFGLKASDSAHFADVLAVASSNANTNVGMMGETFKYVAPVAGALGYSAEDTALAIGLMANAGIKSSHAGTALRAVITRLSTDAGASSEKLGALGTLTEELGVQFYNADGSARDFGDVLMDTRKAWQGLTAEEQINYASTIAGQEAIAGWNAIMNASEADVQKLTGAIEDADGAAQKMAETMQDNLAGDITIFKSAMEGAQIVISDQLTPSLRDFVQFGTDSVAKLTEAFQSGGLSGAMESLGKIISDGLAMVFEKLPNVVDVAGKLILSLIEGISKNLPTLVTAAAQIVETLATGLAESLPELIPVLVQGLVDALDALLDNAELLVDAAISIVEGLLDGLIEALPILIEALPDLIQKTLDALLTMRERFVQAGIDLLGALIDAIPTVIQSLVTALPSIIDNIISTLLSHLPDILQGAIDMFMALIDAIPVIINLLVTDLPHIVRVIIESLVKAIPQVLSAAKDLFMQLLKALPEIGLKLVSAFGGVIGSVIKSIKSFFSDFKNIGKNLISGIWDGIKSVGQWLIDKVTGFFKSGFIGKILKLFGIASPSKVFAGMGKNMALGLGVGFDDEIGGVTKDIMNSMDFGEANMDVVANGKYYGSAAGYGAASFGTVNININGAKYSNERDLARAVAEELQNMTVRRAAVYA